MKIVLYWKKSHERNSHAQSGFQHSNKHHHWKLPWEYAHFQGQRTCIHANRPHNRIFSEYYDSCDDKIFESSSISRWIKGSRPVPADLINFYRDNGCESIGYDFQDNCVDVVYDLSNLCNELAVLVSNDYSLSEEKKNEILIDIDTADESEVCRFIGNVIFAGSSAIILWRCLQSCQP